MGQVAYFIGRPPRTSGKSPTTPPQPPDCGRSVPPNGVPADGRLARGRVARDLEELLGVIGANLVQQCIRAGLLDEYT
jgi:hypothetical protein